MTSTLLEHMRSAHEDIERYEKILALKLANKHKPKNNRDIVNQQHKMKMILEKGQERSKKLLELYEDKDGLRRDEIAWMGGSNPFASFYERLKDIREYYRRFQIDNAENHDDITEDTDDIGDTLEVPFSGEEAYGKYLDLHTLHDRYINMKQFGPIDYLAYLDRFDQFHEVPREKKDEEFKGYLQSLYDYLADFHHRVQPLYNLEKAMQKVEEEFKDRWASGKLIGWEPRPAGQPQKASASANGASKTTTKEDDADSEMKDADGTNGTADAVFCKACNKKFANANVYSGHLKGKKHVRAQQQLDQKSADMADQEKAKATEMQIALLECKIQRLVELLEEQKMSTRNFIEKKQSKTYDELEADDEEDAIEGSESESDSDEEKPLYNPLNLPLGWDGKPIPYWLYKLHGLGVEFKCEICGNYSYWGPRAFERHFQEWRHAHGMRCLKIPNTRHFFGITNIADAYALFDRIKAQASELAFKAEAEEEYEDSAGNVFNRKTFEDLKRQGLL